MLPQPGPSGCRPARTDATFAGDFPNLESEWQHGEIAWLAGITGAKDLVLIKENDRIDAYTREVMLNDIPKTVCILKSEKWAGAYPRPPPRDGNLSLPLTGSLCQNKAAVHLTRSDADPSKHPSFFSLFLGPRFYVFAS